MRLNRSNFHIVQCGKTRNSLSLKKISSNQLFSKFFGKTIAFTRFLLKKCEREFLQFPHCDTVLSRFFHIKFVKAMALLEKLLNSWFDEIFFSEREFLIFPHCEVTAVSKLRNLCLPVVVNKTSVKSNSVLPEVALRRHFGALRLRGGA